MAGETNNQPATASAPAVDQTRPQESQNDQNNRSQLNDSQSSSNDATNNSNATRNNNDDSDKCNRCDRAIRKFEDSIKCSSSEQYCDRVFHRRCVLPYSANDDLADDRWKCEHCYIVRPVENITYRTERVVSPRHHDDSYEYRLRDGRSHLCKNSNCPQIRAYSTKVKSSSDYVIDSSHTKSHMYIAPTVESRREYVTSRPVDVVEEKVVVTDLDTSRYYRYAPKVETEYVVREEVPATYKTYSYVEPQVDFVPAHVERVEITEIAQGIDERIRYREPVVEKVVELRSRPEPVVEKVIEVKRQEPVVEVRRPEPVVEKVVEVKRQEPVVEVRRPEPVVEVRRPEPVVEVRRPEPVVEVKRPEPVVEKVVEVRRQEPVIEFRRPEVYTYAVVDDTHVIEDSHEYFYYATDEDKQVVVEKQQNQDCQHQCRFHQPLSYRSPKVTHKSTVSYDIPLTVSVPTTSTKKITTKQIQVNSTVSESDLLKMRQMERQLNEQASKLRQQEDRIGELQVYLRRLESPEPPKRTAAEKKASALSLIVDGIKDGKRFIEDKSKSTIVSLTKPAPKLEVPNIKVQPPQVPRLNVDLQNGYDSLTSKKGNLTRSEINLRFDDSVTLGDGKNTISSRISDKYFTDSIRTGSLERSSSALATVYDGNRGKDGIYEYVRPISASAIPKASYKGYLERIRFDKILFITEKLYCVVDGCLMHVYKKPTDRRQSKSYKLTGVKVKTPEDYQREQLSSLGGKKVSSSILKHPRSFEIVWKNGKTYQFVVPKDGDFHLWVNALRSSSAIDQHLSYDPRGVEMN